MIKVGMQHRRLLELPGSPGCRALERCGTTLTDESSSIWEAKRFL